MKIVLDTNSLIQSVPRQSVELITPYYHFQISGRP